MLVTKKYLNEVVEGMDIIVNELPVSIKNDIQGEMGIVLEDVGFLLNKHKDEIFDLQCEVEEFNNTVDEKVYSLQDDVSEMQDAVSEMEDKLEWYDLDDMQTSIENNTYEIECMDDKVNELEAQIENMQDEIDELKQMVKTLMAGK